MAEHRNTTATVRMVLKACEAVGVDTDELLERAGIEHDTAEDPDGEVSFEQMRAFWRNAYEMSADPCLAMHAAMHVEPGTYQCYDYLLLNAGTIRQGLDNYIRYMKLINTWIAWNVIEKDSQIRVQMLPGAGVLPPPTPEFVYSVLVRRFRQMLDEPDWAPASISLCFPAPADISPHQAFFQCPIQYEADTAELLLTREDCERTVSSADTQLLKILDQHAQILLDKRVLPDDFVGQVRREIMHELHGGEARRERIAERLCMSGRTLQRRLDDNNIVFTDLVDEVRKELAKTHLQARDMPLAEIGYLLGFSEQSSFTRAFKRWTGQTPKEYRNAVGS